MATARQTPDGLKMGDGYQALIAFASDPDIAFWEKAVKPPGIDGGEPVDNTTMHNSVWRTMASRFLQTLTPATTRVAYDPRVYDQIIALINVEGLITIHFPDNSTLDFYGYLRSFEPGDLVEGTQPEATVNIVPTNTNPSTGAEVAPNFISSVGTD